ADGGTLINPCDRAWADHFILRNDRFQPCTPGDPDAIYTREVYDLNDPRKVRSRKLRREAIGKHLRYLSRTRKLEDRLLDKLEGGHGTVEDVETAWAISQARRNAFEDLKHFSPIPQDCDPTCLCDDQKPTLPAMLAEQTRELPPLSKRSLG